MATIVEADVRQPRGFPDVAPCGSPRGHGSLIDMLVATLPWKDEMIRLGKIQRRGLVAKVCVGPKLAIGTDLKYIRSRGFRPQT